MEDTKITCTNGVRGQSKIDHEEPTHSAGCCGTCVKGIKEWIPVDWKRELVQLLKLAGPVFISQSMTFLIGFVSTVFCGHLGKAELGAVALAIAVFNVTGTSVGSGLASTCDTLISQTYGSGNLKRVGVILQRGILILLLGCCPCWAVLINTEPIMLAIRINPEVASLSQLYVKISMPALPAVFMYQLQARYLQNQGIIWPQVIAGAMGNIVNVVINYVFLYPLDLGVAGSAAALAISNIALTVFLYIYICCRGLHKSTWGGWTLDSLQEWGPFIKLAIPSMLMLCLEWWMFEIGGFLAGVISEDELAAQSIVYQLATICYMFPLGFSVSANVRVGNALGAGNTEQAKLSAKVSVICTILVSIFIGACLGFSKDVIGFIFTKDQELVKRVADVMIIYCFFHIADAIAAVTGGIVRGVGRQMVGALCNLIGYYFMGFPVGVSLMFAAGMGIVGLWAGLFICVILQSIFFIAFVSKLNWKKATEEALVRAGVQVKESKEKFGMENQELSLETVEGAVNPPTASACVSSEDRTTDLEVLGSSQGGATTCTTVGVVLSVRQLVLRRGFTVLIMFLILAGGVFLSEVLRRLLK